MVFVIPRKKVLISRNSVCPGIAHSEVQNGTERNGTNSAQKICLTEQPTNNKKTFRSAKAPYPKRPERGAAPADYWNWDEWGVKEFKWKGSLLGWFAHHAGASNLATLVSPVLNIFFLAVQWFNFKERKNVDLSFSRYTTCCYDSCMHIVYTVEVFFCHLVQEICNHVCNCTVHHGGALDRPNRRYVI